MNDPEQVFREYVSAITDGETANAANIYANNAEDTDFMTMVGVFHTIVDELRDERNHKARHWLANEVKMSQEDIDDVEARLGMRAEVFDLTTALEDVCRMTGLPPEEVDQILRDPDFWKNF